MGKEDRFRRRSSINEPLHLFILVRRNNGTSNSFIPGVNPSNLSRFRRSNEISSPVFPEISLKKEKKNESSRNTMKRNRMMIEREK